MTRHWKKSEATPSGQINGLCEKGSEMDEICLSCLATDFETSFESMRLSVQGECKMYSNLPLELPLLPWESTTEALGNVTNASIDADNP